MKNDQPGKDLSDFVLSYRDHFQITLKVAFTTIGLMAIFGGGGYFLDKKFDIFPTLLIAGLVISFPIIQILIYKQTKNLVKRTEPRTEQSEVRSKKNVSEGKPN